MSDPVMEDGSMNDRKHPEIAKSDTHLIAMLYFTAGKLRLPQF